MTKYAAFLAELTRPFDKSQVKERSQAGRKFSYVTARTVMNRLDEVVGADGWWDSYLPGQNSVLCSLTITMPDGKTITKQDAGGYAGMSDQGDDDKSGFSDAFKRAAVKFGIGRELYGDGTVDYRGMVEDQNEYDANSLNAHIRSTVDQTYARFAEHCKGKGKAVPEAHPFTIENVNTRFMDAVRRDKVRLHTAVQVFNTKGRYAAQTLARVIDDLKKEAISKI